MTEQLHFDCVLGILGQPSKQDRWISYKDLLADAGSECSEREKPVVVSGYVPWPWSQTGK